MQIRFSAGFIKPAANIREVHSNNCLLIFSDNVTFTSGYFSMWWTDHTLAYPHTPFITSLHHLFSFFHPTVDLAVGRLLMASRRGFSLSCELVYKPEFKSETTSERGNSSQSKKKNNNMTPPKSWQLEYQSPNLLTTRKQPEASTAELGH